VSPVEAWDAAQTVEGIGPFLPFGSEPSTIMTSREIKWSNDEAKETARPRLQGCDLFYRVTRDRKRDVMKLQSSHQEISDPPAPFDSERFSALQDFETLR
jgi:hypothetical protein